MGATFVGAGVVVCEGVFLDARGGGSSPVVSQKQAVAKKEEMATARRGSFAIIDASERN
ncbi:MAG: hypothetical protein U0174_11120 [Polyangiaceae bacterium]